jgi:hypothetical protein
VPPRPPCPPYVAFTWAGQGISRTCLINSGRLVSHIPAPAHPGISYKSLSRSVYSQILTHDEIEVEINDVEHARRCRAYEITEAMSLGQCKYSDS